VIKNKNRGRFIDQKEQRENKTASVYRLVTALRIQPKYNSSILYHLLAQVALGYYWPVEEKLKQLALVPNCAQVVFQTSQGSTCLAENDQE